MRCKVCGKKTKTAQACFYFIALGISNQVLLTGLVRMANAMQMEMELEMELIMIPTLSILHVGT